MQLDEWQVRFLSTPGDKILASGRQVGKSVVCGRDCGEWAVKNPNQNVLMCAPTERQAYALFDKTVKYLVQAYPKMIKMGKDKPTQSRITLTNNTNIYCLPVGVSGTGIRFITIGRLYIDECSRVPRQVIEAIEPALLTTGGDTIYLSTFDGIDNVFYECWSNKDGAYDSFTRFFADSEQVMTDRPICATWTEKQRTKALERIERAKKRMSAKMFAQEYKGVPAEDMMYFLPRELIDRACVLGSAEAKIFSAEHYAKYLGVDIARLGDDKTSFQIMSQVGDHAFRHVYSECTRKQYLTQTHDHIIELDKYYDFDGIGIDAGAGTIGVAVLDFLKQHDVGGKVIALNNRKRTYDIYGEEKTKLFKEDMYQNLKAMLERGELLLLKDPEVILSLKSIQYDLEAPGDKIFSHINSDIAEALIRAAWLAMEGKDNKLWIHVI